MKDAFETFVREHPRNPYPERITWETERTDIHNRAGWLVDRHAAGAGCHEPQLADVNELPKPLV